MIKDLLKIYSGYKYIRLETSLINCLLAFILITSHAFAGPYAPGAGQPGTTAVSNSNPAITAWASRVADYRPGANVDDPFNDPTNALGVAEGNSFDIVSLGAGGYIDLMFSNSIYNGPGWDLVIFENGFSDTFLELARVLVSTNGTDFFEFPGISLTANPIGSFGTLDPTNLSESFNTGSELIAAGFASKYRQGYGMAFDLEWFAFTDQDSNPNLNIDDITYIRILDIIGDGSFTDLLGSPVYDPYPETCCGGGFDLDGIATRYLATSSTPLQVQVPMPSTFLLFLFALIAFIGIRKMQQIY
ncbi:MAG: PEP-CTERM sorting domain-containing protein [Pseudomonadota bacterium]